MTDNKKESLYLKAGHLAKEKLVHHQKAEENSKSAEYYQQKFPPTIEQSILPLFQNSHSHLFFYKQISKFDTNLVFYKRPESDQTHDPTDIYTHFHTQILENDKDPSLNAAIMRKLYEELYCDGKRFENHHQYYMVNQAEAVRRMQYTDDQYYKIYFINEETNIPFHNSKWERCEVDILKVGECDWIDEDTKQMWEGLNLAEFLENSFLQKKTYFCAIICENILSWKYWYETCYQGAWQGENEKWETFYVCHGEYPADLNKYQAMVCSGSHDHSYNLLNAWVPRYHMWLRKNYNLPSLPQVLTICFSHQSNAHTNGGKAAKMPRKMVNRYERSYFSKDFLAQDWVKRSKYYEDFKNEAFFFFETHGDHVQNMPKGAVKMIHSDPTPYSSYYVKNRFMSLQFHPEINYTIMYKTFYDLIQTKYDQEAVLAEFNQTWEDNIKIDNMKSRFKFQEVCEIWIKTPRAAPEAEKSEEAKIDVKTGRKRGFLWDIIYNLGFLEEAILQHVHMQDVKKVHYDGKFENTDKPSHQKYKEYYEQKLIDQVKLKHMPGQVMMLPNPVNNFSQNYIAMEDDIQQTFDNEIIKENGLQQPLKSEQELMRERARVVKAQYSKLPAPKKHNLNYNKPISPLYSANMEKLNNYLQKSKPLIEKIEQEFSNGIDLQNAYWIMKRVCQAQGLIILENEYFNANYFDGIGNKLKFEQKLKQFAENRKLKFQDLFDCLDEWFKYDHEVVVVYDKLQTLNEIKQIDRKYHKKDIKENYAQVLANLEKIVKNCEDNDDMKIVAKTIEYMEKQIQKLNDFQLTNQRLETLKTIFNYYLQQSRSNKGWDQYRLIDFAKDFKLFPIFISEAQLLQIYNNNQSEYDLITQDDFFTCLKLMAKIIMPDPDQSDDAKMDKFYTFLNIDDKSVQLHYNGQKVFNSTHGSSIFKTPKIGNKGRSLSPSTKFNRSAISTTSKQTLSNTSQLNMGGMGHQ